MNRNAILTKEQYTVPHVPVRLKFHQDTSVSETIRVVASSLFAGVLQDIQIALNTNAVHRIVTMADVFSQFHCRCPLEFTTVEKSNGACDEKKKMRNTVYKAE
jgi:hypothetical protein